jgi:hypothetical protein
MRIGWFAIHRAYAALVEGMLQADLDFSSLYLPAIDECADILMLLAAISGGVNGRRAEILEITSDCR